MPQAARFTHLGATLRAEPLTEATGPLRLIWLHGWGQSRENLRPLATALATMAESWLIDLPGHGEAPPPPTAYPPATYATLLLEWLKTQPPCPTVLIGHSFGFRVAIHAAHQQPNLITALVALAGAGVPKPLSLAQTLRRKAIRLAIQGAKFLKPVLGEKPTNTLRHRFGSRDYLQVSATMRPTFLAVVNDDVSTLCPQLPHPTLLIYSSEDTETPPQLGQKLAKLIPNSQFHILQGFNHYSLLTQGRHVVEKLLKPFLHSLPL